MRIDAAIAHAVIELSEISESPRLDAELLLCQTIDVSKTYLFAHPEDELDELAVERFEKLLARRTGGEPMAYIAGTREFWSMELLVSPATLVPRPETELLVDLALREIPRKAEWQLLDLGTGSGAIALALATERPLCQVTATDRSESALAVATQNARALNLPNVEFIAGNWAGPVAGRRFNIVVSNPPYVRDNDPALAALQHEPLDALAAGADGMDDIRVLAADCGDLLEADGWLMIEHGAEQESQVAGVLAEHGWTDISCHNDLAGLPRVTVARRGGTQAPSKPTDETS